MVELIEMSIKDLLILHNRLAKSPAGPKTFATKGKLVARIKALRTEAGPEVTVQTAEPNLGSAVRSSSSEVAAEAANEPKARGRGVGELAKILLMGPAGYPYAVIASLVNQKIDGARTTVKSVRWYASKMRKEGLVVPARATHFPSDLGGNGSTKWLSTVSVIAGGIK